MNYKYYLLHLEKRFLDRFIECRAYVSLCNQDFVASWLVRSTPERAVRVRALAGDIAGGNPAID